jgi:hypothetical protein
MSHARSHAVAQFLLLLAATLIAAPASPASLKGKLKKGVYESPAKNFSVPVPKGDGMRVNDGFSRDPQAGDVGGVSIHDDFGNLKMIAYMSLPGPPEFPDSAAEYSALEGFIREVGMPAWFLPASPTARIIHATPATFEGRRAVLALVSLPKASTLTNMKTGERFDSTRGLVSFFHGSWAYLLGMETTSLLSLVSDSLSAAPADSAWAGFTRVLAPWYRTITFTP